MKYKLPQSDFTNSEFMKRPLRPISAVAEKEISKRLERLAKAFRLQNKNTEAEVNL